MPVAGDCEDAAVYVSPSGIFRAIFHCGCSYVLAVSEDGNAYTQVGQSKPWCKKLLAISLVLYMHTHVRAQ